MSRIQREVDLLRSRFPNAVFEDHWVLLPSYEVPPVGWGISAVQVAFPFPPGYPGQKPYGFHVSPILKINNAWPTNATESKEPPFPGSWEKFSWDCEDWDPQGDLRSGSNMLQWALSFSKRLAEFS